MSGVEQRTQQNVCPLYTNSTHLRQKKYVKLRGYQLLLSYGLTCDLFSLLDEKSIFIH